jgi:hypothetical protein
MAFAGFGDFLDNALDKAKKTVEKVDSALSGSSSRESSNQSTSSRVSVSAGRATYESTAAAYLSTFDYESMEANYLSTSDYYSRPILNENLQLPSSGVEGVIAFSGDDRPDRGIKAVNRLVSTTLKENGRLLFVKPRFGKGKAGAVETITIPMKSGGIHTVQVKNLGEKFDPLQIEPKLILGASSVNPDNSGTNRLFFMHITNCQFSSKKPKGVGWDDDNGTKPDVAFKLSCNGMDIYKSIVRQNDFTPEWPKWGVCFTVPEGCETVKLSFWDEDQGHWEKMGSASLALTEGMLSIKTPDVIKKLSVNLKTIPKDNLVLLSGTSEVADSTFSRIPLMNFDKNIMYLIYGEHEALKSLENDFTVVSVNDAERSILESPFNSEHPDLKEKSQFTKFISWYSNEYKLGLPLLFYFLPPAPENLGTAAFEDLNEYKDMWTNKIKDANPEHPGAVKEIRSKPVTCFLNMLPNDSESLKKSKKFHVAQQATYGIEPQNKNTPLEELKLLTGKVPPEPLGAAGSADLETFDGLLIDLAKFFHLKSGSSHTEEDYLPWKWANKLDDTKAKLLQVENGEVKSVTTYRELYLKLRPANRSIRNVKFSENKE